MVKFAFSLFCELDSDSATNSSAKLSANLAFSLFSSFQRYNKNKQIKIIIKEINLNKNIIRLNFFSFFKLITNLIIINNKF